MGRLQPFRVDAVLMYPAAFLYVNVRGVVAERWGHRDVFSRHNISETDLMLLNPDRTRVFGCGLKQSSASFIGPDLPEMDEMLDSAGEFLGDCLKVLRPRAASTFQLTVRTTMPQDSFESALSLLGGSLVAEDAPRRLPYDRASFSDPMVTLQHKIGNITCETMFGPMRRPELAAHLTAPDEPEVTSSLRTSYSCSAC